eukprot:142806_1
MSSTIYNQRKKSLFKGYLRISLKNNNLPTDLQLLLFRFYGIYKPKLLINGEMKLGHCFCEYYLDTPVGKILNIIKYKIHFQSLNYSQYCSNIYGNDYCIAFHTITLPTPNATKSSKKSINYIQLDSDKIMVFGLDTNNNIMIQSDSKTVYQRNVYRSSSSFVLSPLYFDQMIDTEHNYKGYVNQHEWLLWITKWNNCNLDECELERLFYYLVYKHNMQNEKQYENNWIFQAQFCRFIRDSNLFCTDYKSFKNKLVNAMESDKNFKRPLPPLMPDI